MSDYAVAAGIVQFDVEEKTVTVGGEEKDLREAVIKTFTQQKLVKIVLWDEWAAVDIKKGDTVFVDGKVKVSLGQAKDGGEREYIDITAYNLSIVPSVEKNDTRPAAGSSKKKTTDTPNF